MSGKLYICPTPIGNLEDITYRTLKVLNEVDLIAAEDTRHSIKLLNHFEISKPLTSYFEHNKDTKGDYLINKLLDGENIALISDAGMPGISDPGEDLIKQAIENNIEIDVLPGATAFTVALVGSGLDTHKFVFEGFLDRDKKLRRKRLEEIQEEDRTMIFYESPHRLKDTLKDMLKFFGNRKIAVNRELTKKYQEVIREDIETVLKIYEEKEIKGEFVLIVDGFKGEKQAKNKKQLYPKYQPLKVPFTKEMRDQGYTILCPQMSPLHFQFVETAMQESGYNLVVLPSVDKGAVDAGLKYVNNDACYPSILVTGQIMEALLSGKYDLEKTAVIISQTGGGCRATNYIAFIRKALQDAGMPQVPVISANLQGLENNPGFKLTLPLIKKVVIGAMYGDIFMRVLYRVRPYEVIPGSANDLYQSWVERCQENVKNGSIKQFRKNVYQIVKEFDELPLLDIKKPRVGLVGEILVKFHPTANNEIVEIIEREGGEAVMPDLIDFFQYCFYNTDFENEHFHASKNSARICNLAIKFVDLLRHDMIKALKKSNRFDPPASIQHLAKKASSIVSIGNQTGEGWFLTGEMIELIESGAPNIVCMQPFGCLPNHVTGKGAIKALRKAYPESNIVAIDYDPGASEVNQLNRIKLMLSTAFKNMNKKPE